MVTPARLPAGGDVACAYDSRSPHSALGRGSSRGRPSPLGMLERHPGGGEHLGRSFLERGKQFCGTQLVSGAFGERLE